MFHDQRRELSLGRDALSCPHAYGRSVVALYDSASFTDPHVNQCRSLVLPTSTCMNIQSRILCFIRSSFQMFSGDVLGDWLSLTISEALLARCGAE